MKLEYELKAVLQGRERVSIEGQSTLTEVGNMIRAGLGGTPGVGPADDAVITKDILALYQKAARVALEAFIHAHDTAQTAIKPPAKDAEVARTSQPTEKS